ncbi:hypothetical protein ACFP1L_11035 [Lactiplantibacillus nangangensis]|uniref:Uncharacterized protein n=1 Tax=Lactiplantibacillus nangangensis TaxID=2559917 RepID=A0ABW1SLI6_9LACO|nr:hypothetical protein [Lactiplantibacillus nangangensis]
MASSSILVITFGASWFKLPLWLGQNRLERVGRVWKPSAVYHKTGVV